ncbi:MAG: hypothetical protein AAFU85_10415 [Planctomycetota bacterium]
MNAFAISIVALISLPFDDATSEQPDLESLRPQIEQLEIAFRTDKPDADREKTALELIRIANQLDGTRHTSEAIRLSRNLFLSSAPAKARRQAFAILEKWVPQETKKHVTLVQINGPHTTCWGRFQDALDERLIGANDWVLKARAQNTHLHRGGANAFGTIARLNFAIDKPKQPKQLIQALKDAGFDTRGWTIFVETPVERFLEDAKEQ